jgi:hypothetical protein
LQAPPAAGDLAPWNGERLMAWRTTRDAEVAASSATDIDVGRRLASGLRRARDCAWWLVRAHVAEVHLLPRGQALEPPPARWLAGWATGGPQTRLPPPSTRTTWPVT